MGRKNLFKGIAAVGTIIYMYLIQWLYKNLISTTYGYYGFVFRDPLIADLFIAALLCLMPLLFIPLEIQRPSQVTYWLLYILVIVPSSIIPYYTLDPSNVEINYYVITIIILYTLLGFIYKLPLIQLPQRLLSASVFWGGLTFLAALFCVHIIMVFDFRFRFVGFDEVYDLRSEFSGIVQSTGSNLVLYSANWLAFGIAPFCLSYGLRYKKNKVLMAGILIDLMVYSLAGFKGVLLQILLIGGIYIITDEKRRLYFGMFTVWGAVMVCTVAAIIGVWTDSGIIPYYVMGRTIIVPSLIGGFFYDFFTHNPKAVLAYSIFSYFLKYPYSKVPSMLIGEYYFGDPNTQANVHIWADAFANFGFEGLIVATTLLGVILWMFDCLSLRLDMRMIALLLAVPSLVLSNDGILTALFTHGIGVVFILATFVPLAPQDTSFSSSPETLAREKLT